MGKSSLHRINEKVKDMYNEEGDVPDSDIVNTIRMFNEFGSMEGYLNIGYADSFPEYWFLPPGISSNRLTKKMVNLTSWNDKHNTNMLIIGPGDGGECVELYQLVPSIIYAADIVSTNLANTKKLLLKNNIGGRIGLLKSNASRLPFQDNSFSTVFCCEAAFHFKRKSKFLQESHRILKKNGDLLIADIVKTNGIVFSKKQKNILKGYKKMLTSPKFYTTSDYKEQLEMIGFLNIEIKDITEHNLKYMADGTPYLKKLVSILSKFPKLKKMVVDYLKKQNIDLDTFLKNTQTTYDAFNENVSKYILLKARK
ncbi:MAG: methyltransferase domain-containing protein [Thermoplasmatota archaeon]